MSEPMVVEVDPEQAMVRRAVEQLARRHYLPFRSKGGGAPLFVLVSLDYFEALQALERSMRGE